MTHDSPFDQVADAYDRARPGYPDELYDRIVAFGGLDASARVLEVGVGTGKATTWFADRGFEMVVAACTIISPSS